MADDGVRAAVLEAPGRFVHRTFARPAHAVDSALLRVDLAGICGTDLKIYHGDVPYPYPLILGHEIIGTIEETGSAFAERTGVAIGDRVVVLSRIPCWSCAECHRGAYRFCSRRQGYGTGTTSDVPPHLWGAFAELMYLAPGTVLHRLDRSVPVRAGVLAPTVIANGFEWTRERGGLRSGETIVILGAGPQGLAQIVAARECNAGLIVITGLNRDARRLEYARRLGADLTVSVERDDLRAAVETATGGRMADLVVDVTGSPAATASALGLLRRQGRLVLAGLSGQGVGTTLELDTVVWKELSILGSFAQTSLAIEEAVRVIEGGRYPLDEMVTDVLPLERAEDAIRMLESREADSPIKIAIAPNEPV